MKFYHGYITNLKENEIFVFGSNPEGRHGAGTAKIAQMKYGAIYGKGRGLYGNSYALPTKNLTYNFYEKEKNITYKNIGKKSISKKQIIENIQELYDTANSNTNLFFYIAYQNTNTNLNGYSSEEMFDMFLIANNGVIPNNIIFSDTYKNMYSKKIKKYKNTYDFSVEVVNIKKNPEVKNETNYIYCGRGSDLGNPYTMNNYTDKERNIVCDKYSKYIEEKILEKDISIRNQLNLIWKKGIEHGSVKLGCFCAPKRCHCDTIKNILIKKQKEFSKKQ